MLGFRFQQLGDLRCPAVAGAQHHHAGKGQAFRGEVVASRPQGLDGWAQVLRAGLAEGIEHVGAQFGEHARMLGQLLLQIAHSPAQVGVGFGIARSLGFRQTGDNVRSDEDAAGILFPPAPTAVVVLEVVQAIEAGVDLGLQIGWAHQAGEVELLERVGNDQVGQEAGHGLLGAAVGIAGEIAERGKEAAGYRRSDLEMQRVGRGIGVSWEVDGGGGLSVVRDDAGVVDGARNADRLHWEGQLEGI